MTEKEIMDLIERRILILAAQQTPENSYRINELLRLQKAVIRKNHE